MKTLRALRPTRIYKTPHYIPDDEGQEVEEGYLLLYRRSIKEHRLKIIEIELADDSIVYVASYDWIDVDLKGLYCESPGVYE